LKASGHVFVFGEKDEEYDTIQCKHCGGHWRWIQGSGRERGFCMRCMGPTCGQEKCEMTCVPFEKELEIMEAKDRFGRQYLKMKGLV
jgi:hypothetical protein